MNQKEKIAVIILAAGVGKRFSRSLPKQFLMLEGKPVFIHSLLGVLRGLKHLPEAVVICIPPAYEALTDQMLEKHLPLKWRAKVVLVKGGETRIDSYDKAVKYLAQTPVTYNIVITQDAARPCMQPSVIPRLIRQFRRTPGSAVCITGAPLTESLFAKKRLGRGLQGVNREQYLIGRTPYVFDPSALRAALARWKKRNQDDVVSETADILEFLPLGRDRRITVLETNEANPKLTFPEDIDVIRRCLRKLQ